MPVDVVLPSYGGFNRNACCPSRLFTHTLFTRGVHAVAVIQVSHIPQLQYIDEFLLCYLLT